MRIVTAGAGLRAAHVLGALTRRMPEAKIVGYVDPAPKQNPWVGEGARAYPDVTDMLSDAKPDLFCVFSPNCFHLEHIRAGLDAGVRLFAEKPIVASVEETFALASLLKDHGEERVAVGLVLRYSPLIRDLMKALDEGSLGRVASIEASETIGTYHGAFFMRDWRRYARLSGGFMLEKCCHDLDIYNLITGSRPSYVASFGGRRSFTPDARPEVLDPVYRVKDSFWRSADDPFQSDADIVDCQSAILSYASGAHMAFHTNSNVPDEYRRLCVIGSRGMAEGDFVRGYLNVTSAHSGQGVMRVTYEDSQTPGHYGADETMADELVRYLRDETGRVPISSRSRLIKLGLSNALLICAPYGKNSTPLLYASLPACAPKSECSPRQVIR